MAVTAPEQALSSRRRVMTLIAMTLAGSMILVDQTAVPLATYNAVADLHASMSDGQWILTANILPLAAFMILGGRLSDRYGLRRTFIVGSVLFALATTAAGSALSMPMLIAARVVQGCGAALMMPSSVALVSYVYPKDKRGSALGILAGGTAFFAALGPVLGGLLTSIDWRLVFLINVPLAVATIALTVLFTPTQAPSSVTQKIDVPGVTTFAVGVVGLVYGLGAVTTSGPGSPAVVIPVVVGIGALVAFVQIERRAAFPMIDLRLLRNRNLLAANVSQFVAGSIELGLGFLLPFLYLLGIGIGPEAAGIALLPATVPIILAGPLAGRVFDRVGPRIPLIIGFLVLAASGAALAVATSALSPWALAPGLLLQGLGLGIVLTVNDPTGLGAVPESDSGEAAGMLNTSEQLGGAVGIAVYATIELGFYRSELLERLNDRGIRPTERQVEQFKDFIEKAEQSGLRGTPKNSVTVRVALADSVTARVDAFELTFLVTSVVAVAGALLMAVLIRPHDSTHRYRVFGRRSRWVATNTGATPAVSRRPPA